MKRGKPLRKQGKQTLHKKTWKVFADWIKKRDNYICITCGNRNANQAGHFWHGVLDFDEMNINAQCVSCNHHRSGNLAPYSMYLINKYGMEKFKDLEQRHWLAMRGEYRTDEDYYALMEKYKLE